MRIHNFVTTFIILSCYTAYMNTEDNNNIKDDAAQDGRGGHADKISRISRRTVGNLLMILSIVLFITGIYLVLREYVIPPNTDYSPPPTPALVIEAIDPSPSATPEGTVAITPSATPEPTPYDLTPVEIYFPTLEQVCEIQPVGKVDPKTKEEVAPEEPGAMGTVDSNVIAAWYKYGPSPGDKGNAIINGHKSWGGEKGVFYELKDMQLNDEVVIQMNDASYLYWYVEEVNVYNRDEVPIDVMYPDWGEEPKLTLISCTGSWDALAGTSSKRSVVTLRLHKTEVKNTEKD